MCVFLSLGSQLVICVHPCVSVDVCVPVHKGVQRIVFFGPQLTGFQVPLLQHSQPLGPSTKDSYARKKKKKNRTHRERERERVNDVNKTVEMIFLF